MRHRRVGRLLLLPLIVLGTSGAREAHGALECGQEPGNRFFWVERAFCDLPAARPERAAGIVIWNHGISSTTEQWRAPVPPVFRLLQARGWDVIALKRHNLAETSIQESLHRTVERTLEEARAQRAAGYRKVVLAGQSFGGYATLEAAGGTSDLFAAVAMAPGVRPLGGAGYLDPAVVERSLQYLKLDRVALVFPKDDALFGNQVRGPGAERVLARRKRPYLLLDETADLAGHGGGVRGRFAVRYGMCLVAFLQAPELPAGRFQCPSPPDEWTVVRELLLPGSLPEVIREPGALPAGLGPLAGLWYGLLDETPVLFAPVRGDGRSLRLLYRAFVTRSSGGVYDAAVNDGRLVVTLSSKATVTVEATPSGPALVWTSADRSQVLRGTLVPARD